MRILNHENYLKKSLNSFYLKWLRLFSSSFYKRHDLQNRKRTPGLSHFRPASLPMLLLQVLL